MRAIDFIPKGNVIRVLLTNREDLSDVHGDDWDDRGQFDNVYCHYVDGYKDFVFDFSKLVVTCQSYIEACNGCKDDMKECFFPMFLVIDETREYFDTSFANLMGRKNGFKVYFGDEFEPDEVSPFVEGEYKWYEKYDWMRGVNK